MEINIIERFGEPSKMDTASKGTVCLVKHDKAIDAYVQTNTNENEPHWIFIDSFSCDIAQPEIVELVRNSVESK